MKTRILPLFSFALLPLLSLASPACDDAEGDCQAGLEGCPCTAEYQCLDGLQCLSEYCVDPVGSGGSSDPSGGASGGSNDNVAACEGFIDGLDCAIPGGDVALDCSAYEGVACDVTDYLDCLADNTACVDGAADVSGWIDCVALVEDCA